MPELPDVEVYKRYIDSTSLRQKIDKVKADRSVLTGLSEKQFSAALSGKSFLSTHRHGKYLFIKVDNTNWVVLHFGMTGFVRYYKDKNKAPDHVHCEIEFSNDYTLAYDSQRKLGKVGLIKSLDHFIRHRELGVDAWSDELDEKKFADLLKERRGAVKSFLMNQNVIAGIGNIYSDEILYQSGIHPKKDVKKLTDQEIADLFEKMNEVLDTAIDVQADPDRMPLFFLIRRRKEGEQCTICGGTIKKIKVNSRGTYFCSKHQTGK
jgi:formamidopyrimidine-DNA glycosylase